MNPHTETEASSNTQLAYERTSLAYDRTMMAWIRTSTSLISFGFSLYKFFQLELPARHVHQVVGPREFAMLMILVGLLSLAISAVQYRLDRNRLRASYPNIPRSMAGLLAALIAFLGIVALVAVTLRK